MRPRIWPLASCLASCLVPLLACDSAPAAAPAAAADEQAAEEAELEKRLEERKQKRLAEQKAAEEAEANKKAAMEAVAIVPDTLPKSLGKACDAVGESYDAFMNRMYADEDETLQKWNDAKGTQLPMTVATCLKGASLQAAACQMHALDNAPEALKGEQTELLRFCIDRYGKVSKGGAVPPK
jgi:hypothetical protein